MNENHTAGLITTVVLHAVVLFVMIVPSSLIDFGKLGCGGDSHAKPQLNDDVMIIEASIAYLKEDAPKQPQKKRTEKRVDKREGISRDENKQVEEEKKKPEDKNKPPPDWRDFERDTEEEYDPDLEEGKAPPRQGGAFDGEKFGWAEENKGHPYLRDLAKDVDFDVPTLEQGAGYAQACVRLRPDGTVQEQKVREKSGNTNIDRAADEAMRKLEEKRKDPRDVKPVPAELIDITEKWLCFKLGI